MNKIKSGLTPDILRVAACFFVFLLHGRSYVPKLSELPKIFRVLAYFPAWSGVWIFLFLSGFGIGCGFFTNRYNLFNDKNRLSPKKFIKFYIGRFMKIAPVYYLYCIIYEVFNGRAVFFKDRKLLLQLLTFSCNGNGAVSGLGHLWYVSTAMQLYLFMPFIYLIIRTMKDKKIPLLTAFSVVSIGGLALRCILAANGVDWYTYIYTNCLMNLDIVALGMLTAKLKGTFDIKDCKLTKIFKIITSVLFVTLVLYNCYLYEEGSGAFTFKYRCLLPTVYALSISALLLLSRENHGINKIAVVREPIKFVAKHSYTFYIFHIAVFYYLKLTLLKTNFFIGLNGYFQYIAFFGTAFVIIMLLAVPATYFSEQLSSKYKPIEKKVFG